MMTVDAHIHFWEPSQVAIDWLSGVPQLNRAFMPVDLSITSDMIASQWVFIEAGANDPLAEVQWVNRLALVEGRIKAIVAGMPLLDPHRRRVLLAAYHGYPLVHGIRVNLAALDTSQVTFSVLLEGLRDLQDAGYPVDVLVSRTQLAFVAQLAKALPGLTLVLDHAGNPDIAGQDFQAWSQALAQIAQYPNVYCKLSGLTTRTEADFERTKPYAHFVIDCFGAQRTLYGSDFPVLTMRSTYANWVYFVDSVLESYDNHARDWVYGKTAQHVYKLH